MNQKVLKFELRCFTISPTIVPAGKKTTVSIKGYGGYHSFFDDLDYEVRIVPKEKRDYLVNDDFNITKYTEECNVVDAYSKDGTLYFDYTFEGEQEWFIEFRTKNGPEDYLKHYNRWQNMFRDIWGREGWDNFRYDFRVYSLLPDLYELTPFRGDLHTHTDYSDGSEVPEIFCANYRGFGYDFVAVTDHYDYSGSQRAIEKMNELDTNFTVFPGEEVHVIPSGGRFHVVNFNGKASVNTKILDDYEGVKKEVFDLAKEIEGLSERDAQELAWTYWITKEIRKVGGLSIYAHPFDCVCHMYNCPTNITIEALKRNYVDVYEVLNCADSQIEDLTTSLYYDLRSQGLKIPIVGSTDSHQSTDYGQGHHTADYSTIVFAKSIDEVPDAIMDLRSVAVSHPLGEETHIHGSFRLVKYAYFLMDNFYRLHAERCKASSVLMLEYFRGDKSLKPAIEAAERKISEYKNAFFGK